MKPTDEQAAAASIARAGHSLKIEALAGTGKTSTLTYIAQCMPAKRGLYLAFNKAMADDAKERMPANIQSSTAHALAYKAMDGQRFKHKLDKRLRGHEVAAILGYRDRRVTIGAMKWGVSAKALGSATLRLIQAFCQSDAPDLTAWEDGKLLFELQPELALHFPDILRGAQTLWPRICNPTDPLPATHDVYLKLWAMTRPRLDADLIFFDEAQDANAVMLGLMQDQTDSQCLYVGDRFQQIYSWRGAVNAMERAQTQKTAYLTQSFRFGQAVADEANHVLRALDSPVLLKGLASLKSTVQRETRLARPRARLFRTNAGAVASFVDAHLAGIKTEMVADVAALKELVEQIGLMQTGGPVWHPELVAFASWTDLNEFCESPEGASLKPMVRIVNEHGAVFLASLLERAASANDAELSISTVHKAKGLEWSSVEVGGDFRFPQFADAPRPEKWPLHHREEMHLQYVAITRARETLGVAPYWETARATRAGRDAFAGKVQAPAHAGTQAVRGDGGTSRPPVLAKAQPRARGKGAWAERTKCEINLATDTYVRLAHLSMKWKCAVSEAIERVTADFQGD